MCDLTGSVPSAHCSHSFAPTLFGLSSSFVLLIWLQATVGRGLAFFLLLYTLVFPEHTFSHIFAFLSLSFLTTNKILVSYQTGHLTHFRLIRRGSRWPLALGTMNHGSELCGFRLAVLLNRPVDSTRPRRWINVVDTKQ
jgi:hypothetical protein